MPRRYRDGSSALSNRIPHDYPHRRSVENLVEQVRALNPDLVLLFGTSAQGEFTQYSDADLLLVFDEPTDWPDAYRYSDGRVQPPVKTRQEIQEHLEQGEPFWCEKSPTESRYMTATARTAGSNVLCRNVRPVSAW